MTTSRRSNIVGILTLLLLTLNLAAAGARPGLAAAQGGAQSMPAPEVMLVHDDRYIPYHVPAPPAHGARIQSANLSVNYNPASCPSASISPWPQDARDAFGYAAGIWASLVNSGQPIVINACWRSDLAPGVLGSAGAASWYRNFTNAPVAGTWYPVALANALANTDLNGGTAEINANFSSTFSWYFGIDGNTPANRVDFASVVLHEIGHGLGFAGLAAVDTGNNACGTNTVGHGCVGSSGFPAGYDRFTTDGNGAQLLSYANPSAQLGSALTGNVGGGVFFAGANASAANGGASVPLYAPGTWRQGSSYSHLAESFNGTPNALMTFSLGNGESEHSPGPVALGVLRDVGWGVERADVSIAKTATPAAAIAGANLTYTLQVTNAGPDSASNVTVTDSLPPGVAVVSVSPGCVVASRVTCSVGTLASGAGATFAIVVAVSSRVANGAALVNTATVAANEVDPSPANNTASVSTTVARQVDLAITKTDQPDPVALGGNVTYTIVVSNAGPSDASGVTVIDTLPEHVAFVPGSCAESAPGIVTCGAATLASGASATFTIVVTPQPIVVVPHGTGTITNAASVTAGEADVDPANNAVQAITTTVELAKSCDLSGPNVIMGTAGRDVLIGTPGDDVIVGLDGDDQIFGRGGNDCIDGGAGRDTMSGGDGSDVLFGREGKDALAGDLGDDVIVGGADNDSIAGGIGADVVFGEAGSDDVTGNEGGDLIVGGDGSDQIDAGAGDDRLYGGAGADRLTGGTGNDALYGDAGRDRIAGNEGDDVIAGGADDDRIDGGAGDDRIDGGDGADRLVGGTGADILDGAPGNDRIQGNLGDDQLDGGPDVDLLDGGGNTDACLNGEELIGCES